MPRAGVNPHVAGRGHDDDALAHEALRGEHERIRSRRFENRVAQRKVDDPDVVGLVIRTHPLERGNHVAGLAAAVTIEHLQGDDVDLGGGPGVGGRLGGGRGAAARHDARHVRAVAEVVIRRRASVDEVHERANAARREIHVRLHA